MVVCDSLRAWFGFWQIQAVVWARDWNCRRVTPGSWKFVAKCETSHSLGTCSRGSTVQGYLPSTVEYRYKCWWTHKLFTQQLSCTDTRFLEYIKYSVKYMVRWRGGGGGTTKHPKGKINSSSAINKQSGCLPKWSFKVPWLFQVFPDHTITAQNCKGRDWSWVPVR